MKLSIAEIEGVTTIVLKGSLVDPGPVAELHLTVDQLLQNGRRDLAIDTRGLTRIDTVGMSEIFDCTRRARSNNAQLWLITKALVDGRIIKRVFRLDAHIESFETEADGIAACRKARKPANG